MRESVSQLNQTTDCLLEETETKCFHKKYIGYMKRKKKNNSPIFVRINF